MTSEETHEEYRAYLEDMAQGDEKYEAVDIDKDVNQEQMIQAARRAEDRMHIVQERLLQDCEVAMNDLELTASSLRECCGKPERKLDLSRMTRVSILQATCEEVQRILLALTQK